MRKAFKKEKPLGGPRDRRHGTVSAYGYWGCRCQKCRDAVAEAGREYRQARRDSVTNHGIAGYNIGCRCSVCKDGRVSSSRRREKLMEDWEEKNRQGITDRVTLSDLA